MEQTSSGEFMQGISMADLEEHKESEFLKKVSHELRTPLTSIIGYAEVILGDPKLSPQARKEYAEIIRKEGKRLSSLIDDCMEVAFSQHNEGRELRSKENIVSFVARAVDAVRQTAQAKTISLNYVLAQGVVEALVNSKRLAQILNNFLLNSVRLSPTESKIEVEVIPYEETFEIEIRNKGIAVTNEDVVERCKEFRWIHAPNVELWVDGVGLAFAKHLIELQGGSLTIQGERESGMTFILRFAKQ